MDFQSFWQGTSMVGRIIYISAAVGLLAWVCWIVSWIIAAMRNYSRSTPSKDYPEQLSFRVGDDLRIILDRTRINGEWKYVMRGRPPYRHTSPEEKYKKMAKEGAFL